MSIMNIQSGMNSFNHNYLVSNRKKSKKADEHEGTMLNGDGLVGYNIDLLNGREHLTIENLNHEIIGADPIFHWFKQQLVRFNLWKTSYQGFQILSEKLLNQKKVKHPVLQQLCWSYKSYSMNSIR